MDVAVIAMKESNNTTITHFGSMRKCNSRTKQTAMTYQMRTADTAIADTALLRVVRGLGDVCFALDRQQGNGYAMVGMLMRAEIDGSAYVRATRTYGGNGPDDATSSPNTPWEQNDGT